MLFGQRFSHFLRFAFTRETLHNEIAADCRGVFSCCVADYWLHVVGMESPSCGLSIHRLIVAGSAKMAKLFGAVPWKAWLFLAIFGHFRLLPRGKQARASKTKVYLILKSK